MARIPEAEIEELRRILGEDLIEEFSSSLPPGVPPPIFTSSVEDVENPYAGKEGTGPGAGGGSEADAESRKVFASTGSLDPS